MEIYDFKENADRTRIKNLFYEHFNNKSFVLIIGSGFSKGEISKSGHVPSVYELKEFMADFISKENRYNSKMKSKLLSKELGTLGEHFWTSFDKSKNCNEFMNYLNNNFTNVTINSDAKKKLLNSKWRFIYTLNYDDAIENYIKHQNNDLYTIIPYSSINKGWIDKYEKIYKIHGDAKTYLTTGDKKYLIISKKQYLAMITDSANQDLKNNIITDYMSNDIIYIGCSLIEEYDLINASDISLAEMKRHNKYTKCYYVYYKNDMDPNPDEIEIEDYSNCGVTHMIIVNSSLLDEFYNFIYDISAKSIETGYLDCFKKFDVRDDKTKGIKNLFIDDCCVENKINIPPFFIRRTATAEIISNINNVKTPLQVIRGNSFSGKTFILYDIIKEFSNFKIAFFKSGTLVSDELLDAVIEEKNGFVIFDENTLTSDQMLKLTDKNVLKKIKSNGNVFLLAINSNIGIFTKHFFEDEKIELSDYIKINFIESEFDDEELLSFNQNIGRLGFKDCCKGDSLLDYALSIENESLIDGFNLSRCFDWNIINENTKTEKILTLFILLANQNAVTFSQAALLDLQPIVLEYCTDRNGPFSIAIQNECMSEIEKTSNTHDSFRVVCNSKYWLYKSLSNFAKSTLNYDLIAKVYYKIVKMYYDNLYKSSDSNKRRNYHYRIKPYYFLDTIQFTLLGANDDGKSGSLILCEKIYEKLLELLNDQYHFMHQKSKCLLRKGIRIKNENEKQKCLNSALHQIDRAMQLAEKSAANNIKFSIFHMKVTKTIILVNDIKIYNVFSKQWKEKLNRVLKEYYDMLYYGTTLSQNINSKDFDQREISDLRWFVNQLLLNTEWVRNMTKQQIKFSKDIIFYSKGIINK